MLSFPSRFLGTGTSSLAFRPLLVSLVLLLVGSSQAQASTPPCTKLTVSGNSEYPPLLWRDPNNPEQLTGVVPALLQEILQPLGLSADIRDIGSWARVQRLARDGDIDMVAGAFMTRERFGYMDYILPPIIQLPTAIWVPKGQAFLYRHWPDLQGKTGSTLIGNSFGQNFDRYAQQNLTIEPVRSIDQSFLMAEAGRVDYVLYELLQGQVKLAREGRSDEFEPLEKTISTEGLFFTFPKKSTCNTFALREQIADRLYTLVTQGRVDELLDQYTALYIAEQ